jgi:putative transcriptional regulator
MKKAVKTKARKNSVAEPKAFETIRQGLVEARDHARGVAVGARVETVRITTPEVAAIRAKTGLTQPAFAKSIGVAVGTLQGWEQGRRRPEGPARVLLALIDKRPRIVRDELAA